MKNYHIYCQHLKRGPVYLEGHNEMDGVMVLYLSDVLSGAKTINCRPHSFSIILVSFFVFFFALITPREVFSGRRTN